MQNKTTKSIITLANQTFNSIDYLIECLQPCKTNQAVTLNKSNNFEIINSITNLLKLFKTSDQNDVVIPLIDNFDNIQNLQSIYFSIYYYSAKQNQPACSKLDNIFETKIQARLINYFNIINNILNNKNSSETDFDIELDD